MSAIIREEYEAPVLTNEAIEVHLTYLRTGFDAIQAALPVLRDKIDLVSAKVDSKIDAINEKMSAKIETLSEKMNARIEALDEKLSARIEALDGKTNGRIDAVHSSLIEKIDAANKQRAAGDAALGDKIDKLTETVLKNQGQLNAILWLFSIASAVAALVSIARTLSWI
jgi:hypothetical protein